MRQISENRILRPLGHLSDVSEKLEVKRVYNANWEV